MNISCVMKLSFSLAITSLFSFSCLASGPTISAGGKILNATDSTSADAGGWIIYKNNASTLKAKGTVGTHLSGVWNGEIGATLDSLAIGDVITNVIELPVLPLTLNHNSYYASAKHTLGNVDPAEFSDMQLRALPIPVVTLNSGYKAILNWTTATAETPDSIYGYNIFRSNDGISFTKINTAPAIETHYTDNGFPADTRFYAIGLVYSGTPEVNSDLFSANSNEMVDTDGDAITNALDPDDDNDQMPDAWEIKYQLNPSNPNDALLDLDNDGTTNLAEFNASSNPNVNEPAIAIQAVLQLLNNRKQGFPLMPAYLIPHEK